MDIYDTDITYGQWINLGISVVEMHEPVELTQSYREWLIEYPQGVTFREWFTEYPQDVAFQFQ